MSVANINNQASVAAPEVCPVCRHAVEARFLTGNVTHENGKAMRTEAVFACPRNVCQHLFVSRYEANTSQPNALTPSYWTLKAIFPATVIRRDFEPEITRTSPQFQAIYNQAHHAEQVGLDLICGAGYRRALEFLVKDYAKFKHPDDVQNIDKLMLGTCIRDYVDHPTVKAIAARATWLGNDETHYIRRWEDKDLSDLKKVIDLTVHWISLDILSEEVVKEMPGPNAEAAAN
jgi:hypothetical protein